MSLDVGTKLRDARERRGVSLRAMAGATKISMAVLEALERNDVSRLPGGIFTRSFVRAYAVEVGLDPEATIQEFVAQFPHDSVTAGHAGARPTEPRDTFERDRRIATAVVRLIAVSVPIAGVLLYFGMGLHRAATSIESPPAAARATAPSADANPPAVSPVAAAERAGSPAASDAVPGAAGDSASSAAPVVETLQVGVSAQKPCWVSATADGRKAIEQLLQTGDERTLSIRRELVLTVGDAAAVALTLNGATARSLGKPNEVVTVRVNPGNFKEYLLAR